MENNTKKEAGGKPIMTTILYGVCLLFFGISYYYAFYYFYKMSIGHVSMAICVLGGWYIFAIQVAIFVLYKAWKLYQSNSTNILINIFAILILVINLIAILLFILLSLDCEIFFYEFFYCLDWPALCKLW